MWWARPADASSWLIGVLDTTERARLAALRQPADQDRSLVGYALTRLALALYLGCSPAGITIDRTCSRCGGAHGKPRLATTSSSTVEFSVSHSGTCVVAAFAVGALLGVDVEAFRQDLSIEELAPQLLTLEETETLRDIHHEAKTRCFLRYWVRKEAVTKATGQGLSMPLTGFVVSGPDHPARVVWSEDAALVHRVHLYDLDPGPDHVASLAIIGGPHRIVECDGSALLASNHGPHVGPHEVADMIGRRARRGE